MVSIGFFVGLLVLTFIILVIILIAASVGASSLRGSIYFNTNSQIRNAYYYLVAAAIISGIVVGIMLFLLFYLMFKNPFSDIQVGEAFLAKTIPTTNELALAALTSKKLQESETGRLIILMVFFFVSLTIIILTILAVLAAFNMSEVLTRDQKAVDGANAAFIASFAALFEVGFVIIVTILTYQMKSEATTDEKKIDDLVDAWKSGRLGQSGTGQPGQAMTKNVGQNPGMNQYDLTCANDPGNPFCTPSK